MSNNMGVCQLNAESGTKLYNRKISNHTNYTKQLLQLQLCFTHYFTRQPALKFLPHALIFVNVIPGISKKSIVV